MMIKTENNDRQSRRGAAVSSLPRRPTVYGRRRAVQAIAVSLAMLTLVAACSSSKDNPTAKADGPSTASSSTTSSGSSAPSTKSTITIGAIGSYDGPIGASILGARYGIQAWAASVNAQGGIDGHHVKLVLKDDGESPATALDAAKELIDTDKVVAIVGDFSLFDSVWAPYAEAKKVPVIGGESIFTSFLTNQYFFPSGANVFALTYGIVSDAKALGGKIAVLYCAEAPACGQTPALIGGFAKAVGVKDVYNGKVSATAPDYTAICQQIKSSGAQTVDQAISADVQVRLSEQCQTQGVKVTWLAQDGAISSASLASKANEGLLASELDAPFSESSTPALMAFQNAIKKYAPGIGTAFGPATMYAWVAGELFEKVVAGAGAHITSASLATSAWAIKGETLGGLAPPLTFTKGKPYLVDCYFTTGITDGKFDAPKGLTPACAPDAIVSASVAQLPKS
jgi:branched-chain amino acid transport system substrate-binding protein